MFTGLIATLGRLESLRHEGQGMRIRISHRPFDTALKPGESIAVQGVCLTVAEPDGGAFTADLLEETIARSALRQLTIGSALNLERALKFDDRLGGHLVSGHVDEIGTLGRIASRERDHVLHIECSHALGVLIVEKGSIAVDGVSLTVAAVRENGFDVHIIPTTWNETSLHDRRAGDTVNLEADLIAKHVQRLLGARCAASPRSINDLLSDSFGSI